MRTPPAAGTPIGRCPGADDRVGVALTRSRAPGWISRPEQSPFDSIPKTVWYIFTTFSAVGYGDMFPKTVTGKIFGMLTMFLSILALALPITVIGTNFHLAYDALIGS